MRHLPAGVRAVVVAAAAAVLGCAPHAAAQTAGAPVLPIPTDPGNSDITPFEGTSATPNPIGGVTSPPEHPFMAPNGRNNIHDDPYMTDTYLISGPIGDGAEVSSLFFRECASVMFDSQGRIVTICVGLDRPVLALLHPQTLAVLAAMPLPVRNLASGNNPFNDFSGGGYFYLDNQDRAVLSTNDRHVLEVSITSGPGFLVTRDFDLSQEVASNDGLISVLPDWRGRFWFVSRRGTVGTIDRGSGEVKLMRLPGEGISNSFAVDETGGVFIVSDKALYRFDAGDRGRPSITWRVVYPNSGIHKPSQSDSGSGTTPTLMGRGNGWVAITDNADPMNIQVYRRAAQLQSQKKAKKKKKKKRAKKQGERKKKKKKRKKKLGNEAEQRLICSEPVFRKGASATDNSLIGTNTSLVVENNYGYSGISATMNGGVTEPGLTRVDVIKEQAKKKKKKRKKKGKRRAQAAKKKKGKKRKKGKGAVSYRCKTVWTSSERAPSVVPKLSLANGLVYTYTKPPRADELDAWFLTALDFRTGATIFSRLAGSGFGYNNNYAPVTIGPDGTAYVGVLGGLVAFP
jgi:hypothetical protein